MLCQNCNYILSGKENFCPNCGTMPYSAPPFPKTKDIETGNSKNTSENTAVKENFTFPEADMRNAARFQQEEIFSSYALEKEEKSGTGTGEETEKSRGSGGKILILLLICCTLAVAAFGLADYFGLTTSVAGFMQTVSQDKNSAKEKTTETFRHDKTVIDPEINYSMTTAYIISGNGLTLRKGPSNSYAPLCNLMDLTKVQVFGGSLASRNWVYVYCPEKDSYGWLDGSFLCSETMSQTTLFSENYSSVEDIPSNYYADEY